jgi:serine/threonine-protein kinase
MGVVWAARDLSSLQKVAIKVLRAELARDAAAQKRLVREARAAVAIRHPNVVPVREVVDLEDGTPALVMELLVGETLSERQKRERALPVAEVARIYGGLVSAVRAAHAIGIVHRDLKPENIFLRRESPGGQGPDTPLVMDFGVAKIAVTSGDTTNLTATGVLLGTPCYMSPEQVLGRGDAVVDARVDAWALGVMLYESLSGILPTAGEGLPQIFKAIVTRPFWPVIDAMPGLPQDLAAMVDRMLLRPLDERLTDLTEVESTLARHARGAPSDAIEQADTIAMETGVVSGVDPTIEASRPTDTFGVNTTMPSAAPSPIARRASTPPPEETFVLEAGQLLADRFRLERELGRGGMATVWRAHHQKLDVPCAVKFLLEDQKSPAARAIARARFEREAKAIAQLKSPHVVRVLDYGVYAEHPYLAMEYLEGEDLGTRLARDGSLDARTTVTIVSAIARGLSAAHAAGVVHRDLKPANVFLARENGEESVKILDFGIAKTSVKGDAITTRKGALIGTPSFMSPEQAEGTQPLDHRTDLWSLAVIAYRCVTGKLPFKGAGIGELLLQIVSSPLPVPSSDRPGVPAAFDAWWMRAASRDIAERFQSASELADALDAALVPRVSLVPASNAPAASSASLASSASSSALIEPAAPRAGWGSRAIAVGALLVVFAGALALGVARGVRPSSVSVPVAVSPLAAPSSILACPIFEAKGVPAPAGWLGAGAADLACRRATWLLGGRNERTRTPAELLEISPQPVDGFPADPYGDPTARARSMEAARRVGQAFVDGSVARDKDDFVIDLALKSSASPDVVLASGSGRDVALYAAVAKALEGITSPAKLPRATQIDPAVARWLPLPDVDAALTFDALEAARYDVDEDARVQCEALRKRRSELGLLWWTVADHCKGAVTWSDAGAPALDRSTPPAFAITAGAAKLPHEEAVQVQKELAALRLAEPSALGRAQLAKAEGVVAIAASDNDRARSVLTNAHNDAPRDVDAWADLERASQFGGRVVLAAWAPGSAGAWLACGAYNRGDGKRLALERAYLLGGRDPRNAFLLSALLLEAGAIDQVAPIAARYSAGSESVRRAGEFLQSSIDLRRGRFQASYERLLRISDLVPEIRDDAQDASEIAFNLVRVARFLGRAPEAADRWARRFVLATPPRVAFPLTVQTQVQLFQICALASPRVSADCFNVLDDLRARGAIPHGADIDAYWFGARAYARGDMKVAAAAWRPLVANWLLQMFLLPEAFDQAGLPDVASQIDKAALDEHGFAGISDAHAREARRAHKRGDDARARALARAFVDACASADVDPPDLPDMKRLLGP